MLAVYYHTLTIDFSIELEKGFQQGILIPEYPTLEEVGESLGYLILHMNARRDRKDVIELLQGSLFGLGHPEGDHDQSEKVQSIMELIVG
jgi:hypothetical protein